MVLPRTAKESPDSPALVTSEHDFASEVDRLLEPLITTVRHYSSHNFERRVLFFTWVASLFKPISASEVSAILGYDYHRVNELFNRLERSSVLVRVDGPACYSFVGLNTLSLYVPRNLMLGSKLPGRLPRFYVFKERAEIDFDALVEFFNRHNSEVWKLVLAKILPMVEDIDPTYQSALLDDFLFLSDKVEVLLQELKNQDILRIQRSGSKTEVAVKLRHGFSRYVVPEDKRLNRAILGDKKVSMHPSTSSQEGPA